MPMNVLVLGNDGRAHAIAWKLLNSSRVQSVVCAPGNGGTAPLALHVDLDLESPIGVARWCFDEQFDIVIPAGTTALRAGLADEALSLQIGICGPAQRTVELERSRCRIKEFLLRYQIPTAPGRAFSDLATAEKFLAAQPLPVIIKADSPSGGEQIYQDRYAALAGLRSLFAAPSLEAGQGVVIEAFLPGARVVLSAFCDGKTAVPLLPTRLYDRVGDGETGALAPGVGAHTGASNFARQLSDYMHRRLLARVVEGLAAEGLPCWGIIGVDCIVTADGPRVTGLHFAFREGEAEVVLPRLQDDLAPWLQAMLAQRLHELPPPQWSPTPSVGMGIFAAGYPISFPYGGAIRGLDELDEGVLAFHHATANPAVMMMYTPKRSQADLNQTIGRLFGMGGLGVGSGLHSTGGLVMTVVAQGATLAGARGRALINAERIQFEGRSFRSDVAVKEFT
jgi:phosphoribosylamine---glycine ligase